FEVAKRHAVFLEELNQVFARNPAVLGTRNPVSLEPPGVEPLADRARGHFTDLRDLSSCEDLHRRLSKFFSRCFNRRPSGLTQSQTGVWSHGVTAASFGPSRRLWARPAVTHIWVGPRR